MGCEDSKIGAYASQIHLSVIDPSFLKSSNEKIRNVMKELGMKVDTYMSVDLFLSDQGSNYSNHVVVSEQEASELLDNLKGNHSLPKIYVHVKAESSLDKQLQSQVTCISSYEELLDKLKRRPLNGKPVEKNKQFVDVKILKDVQGENEPQLFILEETMKVKKIKYKIYTTFTDLEESLLSTESPLIVTDYVFQNEVVNIVSKKKVKVIVFCDLSKDETYNPSVSFFTNNFQEIVNEIILLKSYQMPPLPTSKVFMCSRNKKFFGYGSVLEDFDLKIRCFQSPRDILKVTKYYFSLLIVCPEEQKSDIEKQIAAAKLQFRVQIVGILEDTENSVFGLRKVIRQIKRGYLVEKGVCKMVDIIDKFHDDLKFTDIKEKLQKSNINYRCFDDFATYEKNDLYCAPLIICNYDERYALSRYLEKVQSRAKIVIYCNKCKISETLMSEKKWAFVSSHFGKVVNYIKMTKTLVPIILDHNQRKIEQKQQKIKNKQHRISALKWSDPNVSNELDKLDFTAKKRKSNLLPEASVIVPKLNINPLEVKEISSDASSILKMPYQPSKKLEEFKKDLIVSLSFLKDRYKINFPEKDFNMLLDSLKNMSLHSMAQRARLFFGEEKQLGLKINESLRKLERIDEKELKHLREIIYLMNLNFISYYEMQKIGTVKLVHWTKESILEQCLPEGIAIFKNFLVMYEQGTIDPIPGCLKLQLELEYNSLTDGNLPVVPYFCFNGRYVFAPYTQFKITGLSGENQSVASLELVKQPDFLNYYFEENLSFNLNEYFHENIKNECTLINQDEKDKIVNRIQRCSILKQYRTGLYEKAAKNQKALLQREEETQNIDNKYLTELFYELAHYQFKSGLVDDLMMTLGEISNNDPPPFIKRDCANLLAKAKKELVNDISLSNPLEIEEKKQKTIQCAEIREAIDKVEESEISDEGEGVERAVLEENNLFEFERCLEIDDNFGEFEEVAIVEE